MDKYSIYQNQEHAFAPFIRILGKGKQGTRSLTLAESFDAFGMILRDEVLDEQLGAFLMLLRVKEESVDELIGFVRAVKADIARNHALQDINPIDLDWPSYAGKRRHHAWYLLSALTLAAHGTKICLHGAAGHTVNRVYTEDLLSYLNIPLVSDTSQLNAVMDNSNICYVPLRTLQPKLAEIINMRNVMGLRSPVHTLARLINPFNATFSIQSIFHKAYQSSHLWSAHRLGYKNTMVIKGDGGEFERNPDVVLKVLGLKDASPYAMTLPEVTGEKSLREHDLSPQRLLDVWHGEADSAYGIPAITETLTLALLVTKQAVSYTQAQSIAVDMWHTRLQAPIQF